MGVYSSRSSSNRSQRHFLSAVRCTCCGVLPFGHLRPDPFGPLSTNFKRRPTALVPIRRPQRHRHSPIVPPRAFMSPSQFSPIKLQGLFPISNPPRSAKTPHTSEPCLTPSKSRGLIIPTLRKSHTYCILGRNSGGPDSSLVRFSMVRARQPCSQM